MTRKLVLLLISLLPFAAFAADLQTTWSPVLLDDTGAPLPDVIQEYRIYNCGEALPLVTTPGDTTSYIEANAVTGSGVFCREVTAFVSPFESARAQGTVILVVPGAPSSVNVQAVP